MKIKVCGMKYSHNILEVATLVPDFIGLIFYPNSKRYVGENFVMPEISSEINKIGVFVNDTVENIFDKVKKYRLDYVQLHGEESTAFCQQVRERVKVIKAFSIDDQFDFYSLKKYEDVCEYFLFDTKTNDYGGSGKPFNRHLLSCYASKPYFLSGGVDLEEILHPKFNSLNVFAIDVNSRFEMEPGLKDINKLKKLFNALHGK